MPLSPTSHRRGRRPCLLPVLLALPVLAATGLGALGPPLPALAARSMVTAAEPDLTGVPAGPLRDAARVAAPSVVSITTELTGVLTDTAGGSRLRYDLAFGGTGFFVSGDGSVVTAAHVAAPTEAQVHLDFVDDRIDTEHGCTRTSTDACRTVERQYEDALVQSTTLSNLVVSVRVVTQDMDPQAEGLLATVVVSSRSNEKDIALLKVEAHDAPVVLIRAQNIDVGSRLAVEGYPESKQDAADPLVPTVTAGGVSDVRRGDPGFASAAEVVETDAPIEHGNSGGPAIDDQGQVVGIVSYGPGSGPNYLISSSDVRALLATAGTANTLGRGDTLWRDGLRALGAGDTATASRDFADCAALTPIQVGCRATLSNLGGAPAGTPAAGPTEAAISSGQAAAFLGAGLAAGLIMGVAGTLLLRRPRHSAAQPQPFHPTGWGPPWAAGPQAWPSAPPGGERMAGAPVPPGQPASPDPVAPTWAPPAAGPLPGPPGWGRAPAPADTGAPAWVLRPGPPPPLPARQGWGPPATPPHPARPPGRPMQAPDAGAWDPPTG